VLFNGAFLLTVQTGLENLANICLINPLKVCFCILGYFLTFLHRASGFFPFLLNVGRNFNRQSRSADLGLLSRWEVVPEVAYVVTLLLAEQTKRSCKLLMPVHRHFCGTDTLCVAAAMLCASRAPSLSSVRF